MVGRPFALVDRMVGDLARILARGPVADVPDTEDPIALRKRIAAALLADPEFRRDQDEYPLTFRDPIALTGWTDRIEAMLARPEELLPATVDDGIMAVLRSMILERIDRDLFRSLSDALQSRLPDSEPIEVLCHLYDLTDPDQPFRTWAEQALETEVGRIPSRDVLAELWTDYYLLDRGYLWSDDFDAYWRDRFVELRQGKEGDMG